ncbi:glycosyltransferase [Desulfovibrio aerotolerans]|uniref:Glycosyltransferase n=1 Tax=Solidesulfovibrio aerotolerans TaxID=295255 RepID=A0A7C9MNQ7_9BACT|nr:glycosyltransferase [Solidesulfovibrio aerotolerans]MYL82952.1 glycosyltransferase [Solidesulfovibrio aerotolerans]
MPRLLNLGCGNAFHPDWVNVDVVPRPPHVFGYNLRRGVPFADALFDAVYHSHVLEHFSRKGAAFFLRECLRALVPGGVLRVAVPDLEGAARAYLKALDEACHDAPGAGERHEWMTVELLDQLTRHGSGGEMLEFWQRRPVPAREFVLSRVGGEARPVLDAPAVPPQAPAAEPTAEAVGAFRLSGECHLWMYDRYSLGRLLLEAGFEAVRPVTAWESDIPDFAGYGLDVEPGGGVRKPDSLFIEARRPDTPFTKSPRVVSFCMQHGGGAGSAALRLHQGLQAVDAASFLYVVSSSAPVPPGVAVIPATGAARLSHNEQTGELVHNAWPDYWAETRTRLAAYPGRPQHYEIFSDCRTRTDIAAIPGVAAAHILQLHWIPGTVDITRELAFLQGRPIVWTLHDMNPITGGCHYAEGCRGFERYCGRCPQLGSSEEKDYSREQWALKKAAYRTLDITVVCPSRWLAGEVRRSSLLGKAAVHVIPNAVPTDVFRPLNRSAIRKALGIGEKDFVVLFGSDSLETRRKGFHELLAALELLRAAGNSGEILLLTFGGGGQLAPASLPFRCLHLGPLRTPGEVALAYNAASCLVLPSLEDNLPNVALEALACGLPLAAFATGGIVDMVDAAVGRLAPTGDTAALAAAVAELHGLPAPEMQQMRLRCRQTALARFTLLHQGRAYKTLYEDVLRARGLQV